MPYQDDIDKCLSDLKTTCKKSYLFGGPVTTPSGKKKCIQDLKDKGIYGKDQSIVCKRDGTDDVCNHTGCAAVSERGNLGELMAEAAPEMQTTVGNLKAQVMANIKKEGGKVKKSSQTKKMRPPLALKLNPKMKGVFTKKAKKANMSVQKYAQHVIKKYKGKTKNKRELKLLKQAVFAKTVKSWKKSKKSKK
jgi:hypothetical protein